MVVATLTVCGGNAQQIEPNSIVSLYQNARTAYSDRQFTKAAKLFHAAAEQCRGSELAVQCEYFAIMSEWTVEPCDECAEKLSTWLDKAKKFQNDALAAGRAFDSKQLAKWSDNTEIIRAKWDRQEMRFELAEQRLRSFLTTGSIILCGRRTAKVSLVKCTS